MKPLRILMLTTFYPPYSFGGDAVGVQRMARALAARGHDVTVVHDIDAFTVLGGKPNADMAGEGIRTVGLTSSYPKLATLVTQQTGYALMHRQELLTEMDGDFDLIWHNNASLVTGPGYLDRGRGLKVYEAHEHWLVCPSHVLWRHGRELCDRRECFRCVVNHKRPPQLWRYTGQLGRKLDGVDLIIAKSEFSKDKHREFGLAHEMTVLPYFLPSLDNAELPDPAQHGRPYFLFVGRLEKIKGLQDFFPAFERYPDADLLILGDGEYSNELKALAKGNKRVKFLGRKSLEELNAYYRGAIGLIVPSVCYETFGIILIESFRLGTPVIARRLGPFPEIVEKAGAGALFSTEDELLAAMHSLQDDPNARKHMGQNAHDSFQRHWSEQAVLAAYGEAFAGAALKKGDVDLAERLRTGFDLAG